MVFKSKNLSDRYPEIFVIDADVTSTIEDVKCQVSLAYTDIDPAHITIKYADLLLNDAKILNDVNLKDPMMVFEIYGSGEPGGCCILL